MLLYAFGAKRDKIHQQISLLASNQLKYLWLETWIHHYKKSKQVFEQNCHTLFTHAENACILEPVGPNQGSFLQANIKTQCNTLSFDQEYSYLKIKMYSSNSWNGLCKPNFICCYYTKMKTFIAFSKSLENVIRKSNFFSSGFAESVMRHENKPSLNLLSATTISSSV